MSTGNPLQGSEVHAELGRLRAELAVVRLELANLLVGDPCVPGRACRG
jgi:hypothetical protein